MPGRAQRIIRFLGLGTLLTLGFLPLTACFESDEERAVSAYRDHDYETARPLAQTLAEAGAPRGYELLALMTAQGLGADMDFAKAFDLAESAIALDASYESTRATIESFVEATASSAEAAFAAGQYGPGAGRWPSRLRRSATLAAAPWSIG